VENAMLAYTICFCRHGDHLLMLYRHRPPNAGLWNGVGGKLLPGELPRLCIEREVCEETGLDLARAAALRFGGLVTWPAGADPTAPTTGMYAFVAELPIAWPRWPGARHIPEGVLRWQPVVWVCDTANPLVVANLPHFLPPLLAGAAPQEYRCAYDGARLTGVTTHPCASVLA
jgi:8-oxo-dGTP diphosphatase